MGDVGEVLVEKQQVSFGLDIADGRPARVVERRGDGRWTQGSQRVRSQARENAVFMHGEREYAEHQPGLRSASARGRRSPWRRTRSRCSRRDDVVALDAAEAEQVGPVCAPGLQRDRRSIGSAVQRLRYRARRPSGSRPTSLLVATMYQQLRGWTRVRRLRADASALILSPQSKVKGQPENGSVAYTPSCIRSRPAPPR